MDYEEDLPLFFPSSSCAAHREILVSLFGEGFLVMALFAIDRTVLVPIVHYTVCWFEVIGLGVDTSIANERLPIRETLAS